MYLDYDDVTTLSLYPTIANSNIINHPEWEAPADHRMNLIQPNLAQGEIPPPQRQLASQEVSTWATCRPQLLFQPSNSTLVCPIVSPPLGLTLKHLKL
jgi:hypothetical protein